MENYPPPCLLVEAVCFLLPLRSRPCFKNFSSLNFLALLYSQNVRPNIFELSLSLTEIFISFQTWHSQTVLKVQLSFSCTASQPLSNQTFVGWSIRPILLTLYIAPLISVSGIHDSPQTVFLHKCSKDEASVSRVQRQSRHNFGHFGGGLHSQSR